MMKISVNTPKDACTKNTYQNDLQRNATKPKKIPTGIDRMISANGLSIWIRHEDIVWIKMASITP